jgi:homocysteine S-methyltransferase
LTQPIFSEERLDVLQEALSSAGIDIPIYIGILPLTSARNAEFLHNEVPGIEIPDEIRNALAGLENVADQRLKGLEISCGLASQVSARNLGLYIITPRNKTDLVLKIVSAVR